MACAKVTARYVLFFIVNVYVKLCKSIEIVTGICQKKVIFTFVPCSGRGLLFLLGKSTKYII